jgi:hypothetical protein
MATRSLPKLVENLISVFKSANTGELEDLADSLDFLDPPMIGKSSIPGMAGNNVPADMPDLWNAQQGRGGSVDGSNPTGNNLPSSGVRGPQAAAHYSPDTKDQAGYLAMMYQQFAEAMDRVSAVEKAVNSLATLVAASMGVKAFPASEEDEKGKESAKRDPDDSKDEEGQDS